MERRERIREIISVLMESSLYLDLPLKERVKLIEWLYNSSSMRETRPSALSQAAV